MWTWEGAKFFFKATTSFLIISVACDVVARILGRFRIPLITIYLSFGVLCGPYVLDVVHVSYLKDLKFVNQFALASIAFMAGAELYFPEIRRLLKTIVIQLTGIVSVTVLLTMAVVGPMSPHVKIMADYPSSCRMGISFLISSIMIARSPSSALALLHELHCKGPVTKTLLGVTVVSDVALLVFYAIASSVADGLCLGGGFDGISALILVGTLISCAIAGVLMGEMLIFYLWIPGIRSHVRGTLILLTGYGFFVLSEWFSEYTTENWGRNVNVEPLLVCMIASTLAGNQSHNRRKFANILHKSSPFIYVPFFTLTGSGLELGAFQTSLFFALIVFFVRMIAIAVGSYTAGRYFDPKLKKPKHYTYMWMTLTTQAGAALGLANEVEHHFDGWGSPFASAVIVVVVLNQIVGPYMFKYAMKKVGEVGKAIDNSRSSMNVVVFGNSSLTIATTKRLALQGCHVTIVKPAAEKKRKPKPETRDENAKTTTGKGSSNKRREGEKRKRNTLSTPVAATSEAGSLPDDASPAHSDASYMVNVDAAEQPFHSPMHTPTHRQSIVRSESAMFAQDQLSTLLNVASRPRKESAASFGSESSSDSDSEEFDPFHDIDIDVSVCPYELPDILNPDTSKFKALFEAQEAQEAQEEAAARQTSTTGNHSSSSRSISQSRGDGGGGSDRVLIDHVLHDPTAAKLAKSGSLLMNNHPVSEQEKYFLMIADLVIPKTTSAVVFMLNDDLSNLKWAQYVGALYNIRKLPVPRMVSVVHDTTYVPRLTDLGLLLVYSPTAVAETLTQFTVTHTSQAVEIVPPHGLNVLDVSKLVFPEERRQQCSMRVRGSTNKYFEEASDDEGPSSMTKAPSSSSKTADEKKRRLYNMIGSMSPALRRLIPRPSESLMDQQESLLRRDESPHASYGEYQTLLSESVPSRSDDLMYNTNERRQHSLARQNTFSSLNLIGLADHDREDAQDTREEEKQFDIHAHSDIFGLQRTEEEQRKMAVREEQYRISTPQFNNNPRPPVGLSRTPSWYGRSRSKLPMIDAAPQTPTQTRRRSQRSPLPPPPLLGSSLPGMHSPLPPHRDDTLFNDQTQSPLFSRMQYKRN